MDFSISPELDALTNRGATVSHLGFPGSSAQCVAINQVPETMNSPPSSCAPTSSVISLLERALNCMRRENYTEGVILFAQARQQLLPDQMQLAALLATLIQFCENYWQAQQALNQASKRFAEIDAELQQQIAILEKIIPALMQERDSDSTLHAIHRSPKNFNDHRMRQSSLSSAEAVLLQGTPQQTVAYIDESSATLPALYITCFSRFQVRGLDQPIVLCSNRNGQAILRYLVTQPPHHATMDILMALLWPEDEPAVAHHKLQVAISALRRSLNHGYVKDADSGYILCKNRGYELNPLVPLRTDVAEFLEYYQAGRQNSGNVMVAYYKRASDLYTGPFLSEDLYADWSFIQRKQLSQIYLTMCNALAEYCLEIGHYEHATSWIIAILKENRCDERAHWQLMRVYATQGRRSDALRQYHLCERILAEELGARPMPEMLSLYQAILNNENLPGDGMKIEPK
jgi:DNA-binding SARP family transcriptional activator